MGDTLVARQRLAQIVKSQKSHLLPGAPNALGARLIEEAGFESVYVTGAGIANTFLGVPDLGLLTLTELSMHVGAMSAAVSIPLIVDADTGFGNAVNVWHSVQVLEKAGAAAIQIEDQTFPKRCGHFAGKSTISVEEMVGKIRSAVAARVDTNLQIVARTDAYSEHGLTDAIERAIAYREAGADILFVEAPHTEAEIATIGREVQGSKILNIVQGGKTPEISLDRARDLGFQFLLFANLALVTGAKAVEGALRHLRETGGTAGGPERLSWQERQDYARMPWYEKLSDEYGAPSRALPQKA